MESKSDTDTKSQEFERHNKDCRRKRKRPIMLASSREDSVVPTVESSNDVVTREDKCTHTVPSESHGFISVIGRRRAMEDAVKVAPCFMSAEKHSGGGGSYDFFAVYDGHGGISVADACRDRLHLLLAEEVILESGGKKKGLDWDKVMSSCFMKMDMEIGVGEGEGDIGGNTMGSTATVVVVGKQEIVVANCGDSRAVLCSGGVAVPLSRDHKPDRPDEKERIEAAGGIVINWDGNRVLGVLATSRSIGDHCMKPFVISRPEINVYERTESDEFVVVASDGLWDVVSNNCACEVVRSCLHVQMKKNLKDDCFKSYAADAAALLAELAMARGSEDNISVIVIQLILAIQALSFIIHFPPSLNIPHGHDRLELNYLKISTDQQGPVIHFCHFVYGEV